jgi:SAM-dependent methyltransferase
VSQRREAPTEDRRSRAELWDERHAARDPIESRSADLTLVEEAGGLAPGTALDLGAGDGRNAVWLAEHGWQVTAVDFSSVAIDRGRGLAASVGVDVEWRLADLLEWAPPGGSFDLVALMFIHLPPTERRPLYARAAAAVADGGSLLVVGHDRSNLTAGIGGPQDVDVLFTPDEIVRDLPEGFLVRRRSVVRRAGPSPSPIDAVVRAERPDTGASKLARSAPRSPSRPER